jgi:hypothetical protein
MLTFWGKSGKIGINETNEFNKLETIGCCAEGKRKIYTIRDIDSTAIRCVLRLDAGL